MTWKDFSVAILHDSDTITESVLDLVREEMLVIHNKHESTENRIWRRCQDILSNRNSKATTVSGDARALTGLKDEDLPFGEKGKERDNMAVEMPYHDALKNAVATDVLFKTEPPSESRVSIRENLDQSYSGKPEDTSTDDQHQVAHPSPFATDLYDAEEKLPEIKAEEAKELPAAPIPEELVAYFVRDIITDGTVLPPNNVFEQTWYLRNGGNTSWPAGCAVKFIGGDNMCDIDSQHPASVHELVSFTAAESTTCSTEVAPGQEAGFTVLMRTPSRAGNFISYWRLTDPDGNKFGHRLWCEIQVVEPAPAVKKEPEEAMVEAEGS